MMTRFAMARYIRKLPRIGHALGPSEERGFELWVGYDLQGFEGDLSFAGLTNVDGWSEQELAARGVAGFAAVAPDDEAMHRKLGIGRR